MMKFILGKKLGMTQIFREDGRVVPVTKVQAGPCVITKVKTVKSDGLNAVQIGYGDKKLFRLNKAEQGQLKGLPALRFKKDFRVDEDSTLKFGDYFTVSTFVAGEKVKVTGTSKGRGFQGVVKRYSFRGSPASHGHKDQLRMPGSIGATGPARVFKGTRMGGHMGDTQITIENLEIVEINLETNELLIKGAVPGARNGLIWISTIKGTVVPEKNLLEKEDISTETITESELSSNEVVEEEKEIIETPVVEDAGENIIEEGVIEEINNEEASAEVEADKENN
ncbi:MAG: 50S ribosomal protein L3 [Candidatus Magasanikbacteria bacterium CG_4_9_14_3_um_filter_32_9]|uniref:Large ribosomal subunit protein uL3 n=1 Tax=Candidatus Magasanikbacteria bacterium CG_4_9_14_3_um_filter_32_9 TaxID=1974644 RepID=A0A2M7Z7G1_9BACT|nr:MAG: 50S ribosomal protein L3 [Candidatus Magasanikbacteria bacterium CG_4_9_14_3_um_filter_32_9]